MRFLFSTKSIEMDRYLSQLKLTLFNMYMYVCSNLITRDVTEIFQYLQLIQYMYFIWGETKISIIL